jgi:hypothetical protein
MAMSVASPLSDSGVSSSLTLCDSPFLSHTAAGAFEDKLLLPPALWRPSTHGHVVDIMTAAKEAARKLERAVVRKGSTIDLTPRVLVGRYPCLLPGCDQNFFKTSSDLDDHYKHAHQAVLPFMLYCDYDGCHGNDTVFLSSAVFREHLRDTHREDIFLDKAEPYDDYRDWLFTCQMSPKWWRCNKCLQRVNVQEHKFLCQNCKARCEAERVKLRMVQGLRGAGALHGRTSQLDPSRRWGTCGLLPDSPILKQQPTLALRIPAGRPKCISIPVSTPPGKKPAAVELMATPSQKASRVNRQQDSSTPVSNFSLENQSATDGDFDVVSRPPTQLTLATVPEEADVSSCTTPSMVTNKGFRHHLQDRGSTSLRKLGSLEDLEISRTASQTSRREELRHGACYRPQSKVVSFLASPTEVSPTEPR